MSKEMTFKTEDEARITRRDLIETGHRVSLMALDPARDLYVFDLYA